MALRQRLSGRFFIEIAFLVLSSAILTAGYMVLLRFDDTTLTKRFVLKQIGVFADTGIPCQRHARDVPPSSSWPLIPTLRRLFPAHNDIHTISFRPALFRCRRQVSLTWRTARPSELPRLVRAPSHSYATPTEHGSSRFNSTMLLCTQSCISRSTFLCTLQLRWRAVRFLCASTGMILARTAVSQ